MLTNIKKTMLNLNAKIRKYEDTKSYEKAPSAFDASRSNSSSSSRRRSSPTCTTYWPRKIQQIRRAVPSNRYSAIKLQLVFQ